MTVAFLMVGLALNGTNLQPDRASPLPHAVECPAQTANGRRLVNLYANDDRYEASRTKNHVSRGAPEHVRRLEDGAACARLMEILAERAASVGGSLNGTRPEFYTVGAYYYAVIPSEPRPCNAPGRSMCRGSHWQILHVFDRNFNLVAAAAM